MSRLEDLQRAREVLLLALDGDRQLQGRDKTTFTEPAAGLVRELRAVIRSWMSSPKAMARWLRSMTSQLDVRLGSPVPTILHLPVGVHSLAAADEAIELANAYGVCGGEPLAESEEIAVRSILGERVDGSWAAATVGLFGPRQATGKNDIIATCELGGLLLFGERLIIHTAHEFPTANESFLRVVAVFEAWDELRRKVARIRYANGEQGIEMRSGQRLKYRARTGGSSRGFAKADRLIYDEAQHLSREHVAASGPSRLANPNSQSIYAGSGGLPTSSVAWALRRTGLAGKAPRLAYIEHTSERVSLDDNGRVVSVRPEASDRDGWYLAMPGLGRWVTEEAVEAMYDELGPDLGLRELGCVWDAELGSDDVGPIDPARWALLIDANTPPPDDATVRLALDAPPDRKSATFSVAGVRSDGLLYVGIREHLPPTSKDSQSLKDRVVAQALHYSQGHKTAVILPPSSPARAWKADLVAAGVSLDEMTPAEYAEACGRITDAVNDGTLRHRGNPDLDAAVAGLAAKASGDVEAWSRRNSSANIAPFVAATCALVRVPVTTEPTGLFLAVT